MEEIKVKISAKGSVPQDEGRFVLAEMARNEESARLEDEYTFKELRANKMASLAITSDVFEFESNCVTEDQLEKHALAFLEGDTLRIVDVPYYFYVSKRVKTETLSLQGRRGSMNYQEKKELIVQEIGTTKSKKILKHQKTKIIDEKKISSIDEINGYFNDKAVILKAEKDLDDNQTHKVKMDSLKSLLPDFNKNAKFAAEIYSFDAIVNRKDLDQIDKNIFMDTVSTGMLQKATQAILSYSQKSFDEMDDNLVKIWCYLNFMFAIYPIKRISKNLKELAKEKRVPPTILSFMVKNFYEPIGSSSETPEFIQTKTSNLKFVAYMVVLILLLNDFKFEIDSVFPYFKMHEKEYFY
jgi:hypothetical protein